MALLHLLLPSADNANNGTVWPKLQVIEISHVGAEDIHGICKIVIHHSSCSQPIDTIIFNPVSLETYPVKIEWMKQHVNVRRGKFVIYQVSNTVDFPVAEYVND